jgi:hypothetical protein
MLFVMGNKRLLALCKFEDHENKKQKEALSCRF